jgi:ABC-type spermidine/putrescine transport system permease subunit I
VKDAANSSVARPAAIDLWFISPFSYSGLLRALFWFSFFYGFGLLGFFSVIHIIGWKQPPQDRMSHFAYRAIGVGDGLVFAGCLLFALLPICRNLQEVRRKLVPPPS